MPEPTPPARAPSDLAPRELSDRELDCLVAERVFGYRRVKDESRDYHGIQHGGEYLAPPTIPDEDLWRYLPASGPISFGYFVGHSCRYSSDPAAMMQVLKTMDDRGYEVYISNTPTGWRCSMLPWPDFDDKSLPRAICLAALAAVTAAEGVQP